MRLFSQACIVLQLKIKVFHLMRMEIHYIWAHLFESVCINGDSEP